MSTNMEIYYKPTADLTIKAEVRGIEEIFQTLGPLQEVFNSAVCGKCGGKNIRFMHRKADGKYDIYEFMCESEYTDDHGRKRTCYAKLSLGQNDMGNLFPRRYEQEKGEDGKWRPKVDADGNKVWLPDSGWVRWDKKEGKYV